MEAEGGMHRRPAAAESAIATSRREGLVHSASGSMHPTSSNTAPLCLAGLLQHSRRTRKKQRSAIECSVPFPYRSSMHTRSRLIFLLTTILLGGGLALIPPRMAVSGGAQGDAKKVDADRAQKLFKDFGDFRVGGIWTSKDAKGKPMESRWEWILDKSFIRQHFMGNDGDVEFRAEAIYGLDPGTGQLIYWGFDNKGGIVKGVVGCDKADEWTHSESGQGKNGPSSYKAREVKLGADLTRWEEIENIYDGNKVPLHSSTWTRKK